MIKKKYTIIFTLIFFLLVVSMNVFAINIETELDCVVYEADSSSYDYQDGGVTIKLRTGSPTDNMVGFLQWELDNSSVPENAMFNFNVVQVNNLLSAVDLYIEFCDDYIDRDVCSIVNWDNYSNEYTNCVQVYNVSSDSHLTGYNYNVNITQNIINDVDNKFTLKMFLNPFAYDITQRLLYPSSLEGVSPAYIYIPNYLCTEDWSPQYGDCLLNNSQIKYYTDNNNCNTTDMLPIDNGTGVACDYCQPDLEFIEQQCLWNGTSYFTYTSWDDNNYYSCCAITGEIEDCIYDSLPYNETNTSLCVDAVEQFELQIDENVYIKPYERDDKVYATIWLNDTTQIFTCQSYVKTLDGYGIKDKRVIQINPIYEAKEKSFLTLDTRNYEDREFFETNKGQATVYYTKENIVVDGRPYLFGVECVGNQTGERLISESVAYISYSIINEPVTLMFWINDNVWALLFGFIALMFIVIIVALGYKYLGF